MNSTADLMVKINGNPELIADLEGIIKQYPEEIKLQFAGSAEDPSHLGMGLVEVSTIIAIINGVAAMANFTYAIYKHLSENSTRRVTIQTPIRTIEILSSDAMNEERIRELVDAAFKM